MPDDGVVEPTGAAGLPSGIVTSKTDNRSNTTVLTVYDITTGQPLATAAAPQQVDFSDRDAFDLTMNRLAFTDCQLHVAVLTEGRYVPSAQWQAPQAYGQGKQCFDDPAFGKDGRIRATVGATPTEPGRVMSVDPAQPDAAPRDEGAGTLRKEERFRIDGARKSDVRVYARGRDIDQVWVTGYRPGGDVLTGGFSYKCDTRVDEVTLLCPWDGDEQYYGSVAVVTVNWPARTVAVKRVAPPSKTSLKPQVLVGPDGRSVAIHDSTGWYTTRIDATSPPVRQPLSDQADLANIPFVGRVLFWS